jgi:hypothetical protein
MRTNHLTGKHLDRSGLCVKAIIFSCRITEVRSRLHHIIQRLWDELHIGTVITSAPKERKFEFDVERAIFLTVVHRLFASGLNRSCNQWQRENI